MGGFESPVAGKIFVHLANGGDENLVFEFVIVDLWEAIDVGLSCKEIEDGLSVGDDASSYKCNVSGIVGSWPNCGIYRKGDDRVDEGLFGAVNGLPKFADVFVQLVVTLQEG